MELIGFAVCMLGWVAVEWWQARRKYLALRDEMITDFLNNMITTRLEVHHGLFYLFREDDDTFVAQGHDAQQLLAHIDLRFRGKKFFITEGDPAGIQELQSQLSRIKNTQIGLA